MAVLPTVPGVHRSSGLGGVSPSQKETANPFDSVAHHHLQFLSRTPCNPYFQLQKSFFPIRPKSSWQSQVRDDGFLPLLLLLGILSRQFNIFFLSCSPMTLFPSSPSNRTSALSLSSLSIARVRKRVHCRWLGQVRSIASWNGCWPREKFSPTIWCRPVLTHSSNTTHCPPPAFHGLPSTYSHISKFP